MSKTHYILEDEDFKKLESSKNFVSGILTLVEFILYFGFIALIAFNKPFLGEKFSGEMTIGIPIAVGTIILSWVLTGIYVIWANRKYDVLVQKIKDKIGA